MVNCGVRDPQPEKEIPYWYKISLGCYLGLISAVDRLAKKAWRDILLS